MRYLIINLKQYIEPIERRDELKNAIKSLEEYSKELNVEIIIVSQFLEANFYAWHNCKTFIQHVDFEEPGKGTGYVLPETLPVNKVEGTLLNHSEHRLKFDVIEKTVERLKKLNLRVCLCAKNSLEVKKFNNLNVDFIAVEPPKLIGGDISVSSAKPQLISNSVKNSNNIPLLVGAGIKNKDDVKKAIELGAKGILIASGIAKSENYYETIKDLLEGFE